MKYFSALKKQIKEIHTKKPHIEFFTALLTVPVLLTVIILNFNNLKGANTPKETPKNETIVITQAAPEKEKEVVVTKEACEAGVGDVSIVSPDEGENVSDNPVAVDISYDDDTYCQVVWSYRVNGGSWSSYDDRSVALYNLSNGDIKLEMRIKSTVNSEIKTLTRRFTYSGGNSPTPSQGATPTVSQ